jgi:hypothetical protein
MKLSDGTAGSKDKCKIDSNNNVRQCATGIHMGKYNLNNTPNIHDTHFLQVNLFQVTIQWSISGQSDL